ncbi:MAG: GNAT family N-acetyltransferase [Lachnospiraceae bacterium]|nr:GNAT family N-acetyltransferase [Lachnospiraceae bacterium]
MDMIQVLGRGTGKLLHMDEDGCAVRDLMTGTIFLTAEEHTAKPLLSHIQNAVTENLERGKLLAVHQAELAAAVREKYDGYCFTEQICRLFVYTKDVPLKPAHHIVFRELTENDLPVVAEHYHDDVVDDIAYLKDRLRKKSMLGAFLEEKLVGFIGMHGEGSIGLLHVLSDWRRKGVGAALEAEMINRLLREGRTPYCYVREENKASAGLQEKLGLYPAKSRVHWLCGSRR